jgi:hypothetical protein
MGKAATKEEFVEITFPPAPPVLSGAISKVNYTHDAMIDMIIAEPSVTQRTLAARFGYTEGWVSQVFSSDAFKARLAERKGELVDPTIAASLEQRFEGVTRLAMDVLMERLSMNRSGELAIKALDLSARALGFGARDKQPTIGTQYVVHLPPKSPNTQEWADTYGARNAPTIDAIVQSKEVTS